MAITPVPSMTDIPPFPALSDRAAGSYNSKAFSFGTHMADKFNDELIAVAGSAVQNATEAALAAAEAAAQAAAAKAAVNAPAWVSGTTYPKNAGAISQLNFQTYRRRVAGAGTIDPMNDSTNWAMLAGNGSFIPQPVAATAIDLSIGNDFYIELNGSRTLTFNNCPQDGYSFTLDIDVTSGVVTLPASVRTPNNTPYVLTAGKGHSLMFRTRNRGARWRLVAATNFDL